MTLLVKLGSNLDCECEGFAFTVVSLSVEVVVIVAMLGNDYEECLIAAVEEKHDENMKIEESIMVRMQRLLYLSYRQHVQPECHH